MINDDKLAEIQKWINETRKRLFNQNETILITTATLSDMQYLLNEVKHLNYLGDRK